jgi:hypothetical protein
MLPDQANGSKTSADDFLAGGHSFRELMALMRLYNPRDLETERLKRGERLRLMLEDLRRAFWAAEFKGDVPFGEGGSGHTGGIFGDGTDRLWMHRHDCVLQDRVSSLRLHSGVCSVADE